MNADNKTNFVEEKVKIKVEQHPNEKRYKNVPTYESNIKYVEFLSRLSTEDTKLLGDRDLVLNEQETAEIYDQFQKEDKVGLIIPRHKDKKFTPMLLKINEIFHEDDYFIGYNELLDEEYEVSFQDVSVALDIGYCEILYRNDEVFGEEKEKEVTVRYYFTEENEEKIKEIIGNGSKETDASENQE